MVEISEVEAGSAAQRAGIKPHDILISINGFDIGDVLEIGRASCRERV